MLSPPQAERMVLEQVPSLDREYCPILQAHGRVLRAEIRADRDFPPFDRVTMDGFALRSAALAAGVRKFRIEAVQPAGMPAGRLGEARDTCIEIMTGAVLPAGADCVIPYEDAKHDGTIAEVTATAPPGQAIHRRGSDQPSGGVLLSPGVRLTGREIAVAAACGYSTLDVSRLPKIAVVASGDELVELESVVAPHQIRRSNDYALRAALIAAGFPLVERFHLHDQRHEIERVLSHLLAEFDVVLLTGGVSKGKFDFLPAELERQGVKKILQGVAQRPGKPFWFGLSRRQTPVFALPGNPVSAYTCLHRYVLPGLEQASGLSPAAPRTAALAAPVSFKPKLACLLPVKLSSGPAAELLASPAPVNTSGDFAGLVGSDGFVELPAEPAEFPAGTVARFWAWV
jgi:molybdopterin molybdotransferase